MNPTQASGSHRPKLLWALLDLVTILVLGSGLHLWVSRRKASIELRLVEAVSESSSHVPFR